MNTSTTMATRDRRLLTKAGVALLAVALIGSMTALPASAYEAEGASVAERVAEQVSEAAPDGAQPVQGSLSRTSVETVAGGTEATVSLDSSDGIVIETSIDGEPLQAEISLPSDLELSDGVLASDGTVVFAGESSGQDPSSAAAIQTLPNGDTRIQTVIPNSGAEHEFGYGMDGYQATIDAEGNAAFVSKNAEGAYIPIEPAWAVDANGDIIETYYEVRGDELFQVVVPHAGTTYPVVADPTWGWRNAAWGITLNRLETSRIKDYAAAAGMCATLAKSYAGFAVACGAWASYLQVQAATANNRSPKGCLHVVVVPLPGAITHTHC